MNPPTPSIHRLRLGLPGYLILFAPLAFVSQRQYYVRKPLSPQVFLPISTHFTATPGIPLPSHNLDPFSIGCRAGVELRDFTTNLKGRLHTLYTQ